jgi:AcrR family transcriptional regulator
MSTANFRQDPRANQKSRTRKVIVAAAEGLRQEGIEPTVADAAERAGVSRATAYRYFPTQESLTVELTQITPSVLPVEKMLGELRTPDVQQRLLSLLDIFTDVMMADETHFRRATRVYQDIWLRNHRRGGGESEASPIREGRRMRWLEQVLEPLQLPAEQKQRLIAALALTLGGEAIIVMKDVCRLDNAEAKSVLRWAASALLRAAIEEK